MKSSTLNFDVTLNEPYRTNEILCDVTINGVNPLSIESVWCISLQSELRVEPWMVSQIQDAFEKFLKSEEKTERFCRSEDRCRERFA